MATAGEVVAIDGNGFAFWIGEGRGVVVRLFAKRAAGREVNDFWHGVPRLVGFYFVGHSRRLTDTGGHVSA